MKRTLILISLALCAATCAVFLLAGGAETGPRVVAAFHGLTQAHPNRTFDKWFVQMSPQHAQLMEEWFQSGTNAAQFSITNNTRHAIRVHPLARLETADQQMDTPVLTARNFRGVYIGAGEAKTVEVASFPHGSTWRVRFCYVRDDGGGHLLKDAQREATALLAGAPSPSRTPDDFRNSIAFFSEWIQK